MAATQLTKEEAKAIGLDANGKTACVAPKNWLAIMACYQEIIRLLCECPEETPIDPAPPQYATPKK